MKANRKFNPTKDAFLVFFTVSTAIDFKLDAEKELRDTFRQEGIQIPENLQEIINNAV